jgi:acyl carrier protein
MSAHKETIRTFIINNFLFGDAQNLRDNTSFLNEGIIDSTGILEVVSFLEETFSIHVDDHELIPDNLDSINNIDAYVTRKTSPSV